MWRVAGTVADVGVLDTLDSPMSFDCPRCGAAVEGPFYGPCSGCHDELRAMYQAEATEMADVTYEPKMNVTPNAVALKDD